MARRQTHTASTAFRHLPPKEGCRQPVFGVYVKRSGGEFRQGALGHESMTWRCVLANPSLSRSPEIEYSYKSRRIRLQWAWYKTNQRCTNAQDAGPARASVTAILLIMQSDTLHQSGVTQNYAV